LYLCHYGIALNDFLLTGDDGPLPALSGQAAAKQLLRKAIDKAKTSTSSSGNSGGNNGNGGGKPLIKFGSNEFTLAAAACNLYSNALKTLSQLRNEILLGLSYENKLIVDLWKIIQASSPKDCGLKGRSKGHILPSNYHPMTAHMDHLSNGAKASSPEFQPLTLFCDCLTFVVTVLDDVEFYEREKPFSLGQYVQISTFLNHFLYKASTAGESSSLADSLAD